jgi:predicted TIM-barrel fold metal-dependent hydrolase
MLGRFPDVPLVIYSLAGPPMDGGAGVDPALLDLARWPAVYLNASPRNLQPATDPASPQAALLAEIVERFGPDRLMWGSYSMFRDARSAGSEQPTLAELVQTARTAFDFLAPDERAAVLGGTAWSLYGRLRAQLRSSE